MFFKAWLMSRGAPCISPLYVEERSEHKTEKFMIATDILKGPPHITTSMSSEFTTQKTKMNRGLPLQNCPWERAEIKISAPRKRSRLRKGAAFQDLNSRAEWQNI